MNNLERIEKSLREQVVKRNQLERNINKNTYQGYSLYIKKQELKKTTIDVLILKYYYYNEENRFLFSIEDVGLFNHIGKILNDESFIINDLMSVEFDYYKIKKEDFIKGLLLNFGQNVAHKITSGAIGTEFESYVQNEIAEYPNSDASRNKIQQALSFIQSQGYTNKSDVQSILLISLCDKHHVGYYAGNSEPDKRRVAAEVLKILNQHDYDLTPVNSMILKYEVVYNLLHHLRAVS